MSDHRDQRHAEDVAVDEELPVAVRNASRAQLFLYSAATWNPHRIHYDRAYAESEGHPDVVVHGPLQGAWITQHLTDWAGPRGRLLAATWQHRGPAFPETDYELRGRVTGVDAATGDVDVEVWVQTTDGQRLAPGTGRVRLPRRSAEG